MIKHKDWDINEHATSRFKNGKPIVGVTFQNGLNDINPDGTFSPCDMTVEEVTQGVTYLKTKRGRWGEIRFGDSSHPNSFLVKIKNKGMKGVSFKYTGAVGSSMTVNDGKPLCEFDNGISIESTPYYKGVKMDIIVNDPLTAPIEYPFSAKDYGQNYIVTEEDNGLTFTGEDQEPIRIKPPYAVDANGDIGAVTINYLGMENNLHLFKKVVDETWLRQAAAPVRIDPDITIEDGVDGGIISDTAFSNIGLENGYNFGAFGAGVVHQNTPTNQVLSWLKVDLSIYSGITITSAEWGLDIYQVDGAITAYSYNCLRDIIEGVSIASVNTGEPTWDSYSHPTAWTSGGGRGAGDRNLTADNNVLLNSTGTAVFPVSNALAQLWLTTNYGMFIDSIDAVPGVWWRSSEASSGNKPYFFMEYTEIAEDYTTFIEVDPNNHITITSATKIDWSGLAVNEVAHVYKSYGVDFFDGDYGHQLDFVKTSGDGSGNRSVIWQLGNVIKDMRGFISALDRTNMLFHSGSGANYNLHLAEIQQGVSFFQDSSVLLTNVAHYYITLIRDETVGSFGQLQCFIYSDSGRTVLVDTLTLALHEKADFEYAYALNSDNFGSLSSSIGYVQNLDLGLEEVGIVIFRRRREGY